MFNPHIEGVNWIETDSKDNALATATHNGETGKTHFIKKVIASFTTAPSAPKLVQVKKGTSVLCEMYISGVTQEWDLEGIPGNAGGAVSVELAAHGGGSGNYGKLILIGKTF